MRPMLLIDISYLAHRAWFTLGELNYGKQPTGVVFGVLEQIRTICYHPKIYSNRVAAFFDSSTSIRSDAFPGYKVSRTKAHRTPEDWKVFIALKEQIERLRAEVLPQVGICCYLQNGLEADDLMARAAQFLQSSDRRSPVAGVIVSADSDLHQCVTDRIHLFDPAKFKYLTKQDILRDTGLAPKQHGLVKVLAGCSSDEVPGIPGVGRTTAIQYLKGQLPPGSSKHKKITSRTARPVIERNKGLVLLPHKETADLTVFEPEYDVHRFFRTCKHLGFRSLLRGDRRQAWVRLFTGMKSTQDRVRERQRHGTKG